MSASEKKLAGIHAELARRLEPGPRVANIGLDRDSSKRRYLNHVPQIECADGFKMSVQASSGHYCVPRDSIGPWTHVEIGYPSGRVVSFMPYMDGGKGTKPTDTVYGFVPIDLVVKTIARHGGFAASPSAQPLNRPRIKQERTMAYVIFDIERTFDERVCRTAQDVRDFINGADLSRSHFKVLELDDAPDVTDQFQVPEPEPVEEYPETFNRRQYMRRIGAPGL